jgi:hypothetical protein
MGHVPIYITYFYFINARFILCYSRRALTENYIIQPQQNAQYHHA